MKISTNTRLLLPRSFITGGALQLETMVGVRYLE
jgi:hypothetical protein